VTLTWDQLAEMPAGYAITVAVELTVLWFGLAARHPARTRVFAGFWLTACTYPVVWLVLPPLFEERWAYLLVAETFAPVAECGLFWWVFVRGAKPDRRATARDFMAITLANLGSFGLGEAMYAFA
jgi:hypothetical protein